MTKTKLTYFSMFSGIGGFELGISKAMDWLKSAEQGAGGKAGLSGQHNQSAARRLEESGCIGYSEIDSYAIKVYERQFDGHTNYGDATTIDPKRLPDFELLVGGFPCQAFSVAGKRAGFNEARGTLFFDIARVLKHCRPRHLVLENVKGLLSHDNGKTFQVILGILAELGYRVEWQLLNSKDFGVPQNRERVFIVGHARNECAGQILPITGKVGGTARASEHAEGSAPKFIKARHLHQNGELIGDSATVMSSEILDRGAFRDTGGRALTIDKSYHKGPDNHGQRPVVVDYKQVTSKTRRGRVKDGYTGALDHDVQQGILADSQIRRLTPRECERLQGFPDDWTLHDQQGGVVSDSQRYKMCGNAVTVNTVQAVMERLISHDN